MQCTSFLLHRSSALKSLYISKTIADEGMKLQTTLVERRAACPEPAEGSPPVEAPKMKIRSQLLSPPTTRNQLIQLRKQRRIIRPWIIRQLLTVTLQIEQERFHSLFTQIVPIRPVSSFADVVRIQHLLKLPLHRPCQIRLPEIERLADEREAGVRDHRATPAQIAQKRVEPGLPEFQIRIRSFPVEAVTNKFLPHGL